MRKCFVLGLCFLERENIWKYNVKIRNMDIKERTQIVVNVPDVEMWLSNKYQADDIYSFSEAKIFYK